MVSWYVPWTALLIAAAVSAFFPRALRRLYVKWTAVTRPAWSGPLICFLFTLVVGALPLFCGRVPLPAYHDEFSYLLAADTFAHGRLVNPSPKGWEAFETFHEILHPVYASKFPPAQGLALAAGQLLGQPAIGAFGAVALASAACCWALMGIVARRWAALGTIALTCLPLIYDWGQSYWGGGVAMLGGGLLIGAALRVIRGTSSSPWKIGSIAGIGLAILANSRPLEGAMIALLLGASTLIFGSRAALLKPALWIAALAVLIPTLAWMGYYNWRVTGSATRMPYSLHAEQYMQAPLFWWSKTDNHPAYRHDRFRSFYGELEYGEYADQLPWRGFLSHQLAVWRELGGVLFAPWAIVLLFPALAATLWKSRSAKICAIVIAGLLLLHAAVTPWWRTHYFGPAAPCLALLLALALRRTAQLKNIGPALTFGFIAACLATVGSLSAFTIGNTASLGSTRAALIEEFRSRPQNHLIFVRYSGNQHLFEWVFNDADIEHSQVIFARDMGEDADRKLAADYPGRRYWLLDVAGTQIRPPMELSGFAAR